jgi:hypothetical protein
MSRGIGESKHPRVRKVAEQASITSRQQSLFNYPYPEDVDDMAAAA